MKTIRYEFCDGCVSEVEVTDEIYAVHEQLVKEEKRNHKRETRRHISLNYLNENGIDFEAPDADPLLEIIRRGDEERLHKAMGELTPEQRELIGQVFFDCVRPLDIALSENVSKQAINNRLGKIYRKQKIMFIFKKCNNLFYGGYIEACLEKTIKTKKELNFINGSTLSS